MSEYIGKPLDLGVIATGAGLLAAGVATVWGGCEVGSVINDYFDIQNPIGGGATQFASMYAIGSAFIYAGLCSGALFGSEEPGLVRSSDLTDRLD